MMTRLRLLMSVAGLSGTLFLFAGCTSLALRDQPDVVASNVAGSNVAASSNVPRELSKVSHPIYRVAPPDILLIEAVHNIRPPTSPLRVGDVLQIQLGNPEPLSPPPPDAGPVEQQLHAQNEAQNKLVSGEYRVQPDGRIDLGPLYGSIQVEGFTVQEAENAIRDHLTRYTTDEQGRPAGIKNPQLSVTLPEVTGKQVIAGEHLVRPDGTVALGVYGSVHVAGMTLAEVKAAVERHLSQFIRKPEVSVDVAAYNSRVYYVITDGGGFGEQVVRLPCTGNETVLDAVANIQGLSQISSKRVWVARPSPAGTQCAQTLDVNWREITKEGVTTTNYQILPGDRVYIAADRMIAFDNFLSKIITPVERVFGVILLGNGTFDLLQSGATSGGSGFGGGFGGGF